MVQVPAPITTATDLATLAIELIARAKCEYGDVRFCTYRNQNLYARDLRFALLASRSHFRAPSFHAIAPLGRHKPKQ